VRSTPGQGSAFSFSVTLPTADEPQAMPAGNPFKGTGRLAGMRVLAVEDIEVNRFLLGRILELEGARAQFAEHGLQAVQTVQAQIDAGQTLPFDVVLMDLQMPVMDGYEATRRLLAMAPALPVVGVTAHALPQERARCLAGGMAAHVAKPVDVDELVVVLHRVCGWKSEPDPDAAASTPQAIQQPTSPTASQTTLQSTPTVLAPTAGIDPPADEARLANNPIRPPSAASMADERQSPSPPGATAQPAADRQPSTATRPVVIDWSALGASLGAGDAFIDQLAKVLAGNLAAKPSALLQAAAAADLATIAREAHSIKGVAGNVRAEAAHALARDTETAARAQDPQACALARQLAVQVDGLIDAARQRLEGR
jgi:CheY-like chemotaxis protein